MSMNRRGPCVSCGELDEHVIHDEPNAGVMMPSGRVGHTYFPKGGVPSTREEARDWFRALRRDKDDDLLADDLLALLRSAKAPLEELACAVADDWTEWRMTNFEDYETAGAHKHRDNLDALERATRGSSLRKTKP